ncbi:MAG: energy-coupling factor ABC transporter ATP-binding protein [Deltaproteobacteria bacterium]|jgi:biotin transport system ATP-binding protein|nr:energy-coupling factor ABC transporter ATP-binding protein [Deltaproteobacteria bacterium]
MIQAKALSFRYPGAARATLHSISFQVEKGQLCCLLGINGSGKSTLLSLLAGLLLPEQGELNLGAQAVTGQNSRPAAKIALLPQDPDLYILGSLVEEDLLLALDPQDVSAREKALSLAEEFGLGGLLPRPVHTLSYGQKRKLCLASALASSPDLLLLDEPFAGLDHPSSLTLREILLRNKQSGLTQVLALHDLDMAADLADRFILLEDGQAERQGAPEEIYPLLPAAGVRPPCWWFTGAAGPLWNV